MSLHPEYRDAVERTSIRPDRAGWADQPATEARDTAGDAGLRIRSRAPDTPLRNPISTIRERGVPAASTWATTSTTAAMPS